MNRFNERRINRIISESISKILMENDDIDEEIDYTDLIKKIVNKAAYSISGKMDDYVVKVYPYSEDIPSNGVELEKDIMVQVDGIWYRCATYCHRTYEDGYDPGTYFDPPYGWTDIYDYVYIYKIKAEKTKEILYASMSNGNVNTQYSRLCQTTLHETH